MYDVFLNFVFLTQMWSFVESKSTQAERMKTYTPIYAIALHHPSLERSFFIFGFDVFFFSIFIFRLFWIWIRLNGIVLRLQVKRFYYIRVHIKCRSHNKTIACFLWISSNSNDFVLLSTSFMRSLQFIFSLILCFYFFSFCCFFLIPFQSRFCPIALFAPQLSAMVHRNFIWAISNETNGKIKRVLKLQLHQWVLH